jgi:hypothetical protein
LIEKKFSGNKRRQFYRGVTRYNLLELLEIRRATASLFARERNVWRVGSRFRLEPARNQSLFGFLVVRDL